MKNAPTVTLESLTEGKRKITYGVVKPGDPDPCEGIIFIRGGDISEGKINIPGLRTIRKDVSDQYKRTLLRGGELLVSLVGNPGEVASAPKKLAGANIARQVGLIDLTDDVCHKFVEWFLRSPQGQAEMGLYVTGAVQKVINLADLKRVRIPLPEIATQRKIASILSAYDDLIENNTRRIEILEEMARRLYEEWFVHFRFPGHEEAELESVTVGDIAEVIRGRSYRSKDLVAEGGFPFVNLKCVHRDGGFRRDGLKRYDGKYKPDQVVHHGDIVMAVTDMTQERRIVARAAMVPDLEERGGIISMDLVKVSPKANIPKEFLYAALRWSDFSENVKNHANGANVLHLHPDHIRSHVMQVPPDESRLEFSRMVKPLFDLCESLEKKNTNLRAQRDLLLPKLVSGEIDVSDISMPDDKEVEAA